jgi:antitoxin component of MazEF toxin-antitoxin module
MDKQTQIKKVGGSLHVLIPSLYAEHIGIVVDDFVILRDELDDKTPVIKIFKDTEPTSEVETLES